ncbi:beta-parvin isoform X4 [Phocoena sinus]|uniref:beta-parvin isoform X4 n=1 Tax=Phocoena sinus TaxID=42100 RepID=UPI0013C4765C|nr:beta-parvin isoform X4 [Phocoena sinus]
MSSAPLRSPALRPHRMKKDESFLGKLGGTLARKKKAKEVSDLQEEGKNAINLPMSPASVEIHPEDTLLEENQERMVIDPTSRDDPRFRELVKVLIDWVNDVLVGERIIVKQLEEDLYDGQVLQKLLEKLAGCKLNVAEVTQSEIAQKQKLQTALQAVQELLRPHGRALQWTVDTIHGKNLVAILHLLVALAMHFRAPIRLPEHVSVQVVVIRKREGLLHSSHITEELTTTTEMMMGRFERDAFDTLFDHAPDKLSVVKKQTGEIMEALHEARDGKCHICPPAWELNLLLAVPVSLCFAVSHHICEQAPGQAEFGGDGTRDPVCRWRVPGSTHGASGRLLCTPAQLLPDPGQLRSEGGGLSPLHRPEPTSGWSQCPSSQAPRPDVARQW